MPWFRQPLEHRLRQPDPNGPIRVSIRARIALEIQLAPTVWYNVDRFLVDTGASFTILSTEWARNRGIRVPARTSTVPLMTAGGDRTARVRDADLRVRFARLCERPFDLAVLFSDDYSPAAPPLLGLHNLLNSWQFTVSGAFDPAAAMGHMRFDTL